MAPRRLVAGNWKMNGLKASLGEARKLRAAIEAKPPRCEVALCPPATLIAAMSWEVGGSGIHICGQDCHGEPSGAFTGDISAEMLKDAGASLVILGHSERRHGLGERDELIARKIMGALRAQLRVILCVGETEAERDGGKTLDVVGWQLAGSIPPGMPAPPLVIAYEPVWAIGTGRTPEPNDIVAVHGYIRARLKERFGAAGGDVAILYGGSVKPSNAGEILHLPDVDGALVGGASLKADDFLKIIAAA